MPNVSLDIPEDLLVTLREQPADLSHEIRRVAAVYYFGEKRLSLGQAARFAGMNRLDFLDALNARGVPAFGPLGRRCKGGSPGRAARV